MENHMELFPGVLEQDSMEKIQYSMACFPGKSPWFPWKFAVESMDICHGFHGSIPWDSMEMFHGVPLFSLDNFHIFKHFLLHCLQKEKVDPWKDRSLQVNIPASVCD